MIPTILDQYTNRKGEEPVNSGDHYIEQQITLRNVEAAIHRYDTDTDRAERGRLTIIHHQTLSSKKRIFGRWEPGMIKSDLSRMPVADSEQALCDEFVAQITGSDPNSDPTMDAIVERLNSQSDDEDKPIGMFKGQPIYAADRHANGKGTS